MLFQQLENCVRHVTPLFSPGTRGMLAKRTLWEAELPAPPAMRYPIMLYHDLPWISTKCCTDNLAKECLHFQFQGNLPRSNSHRTRRRPRVIQLHYDNSVWPAHLKPTLRTLSLRLERIYNACSHNFWTGIGIQHDDSQAFTAMGGLHNYCLSSPKDRAYTFHNLINIAGSSISLFHNRAEQRIRKTITCGFANWNLLDFIIHPSQTRWLPLVGILYSPPHNS
mmetsp:Transcript_18224/g.43908  ORF Transcript_18224/g.43908 Transcript_18224/m.43908 type:complete len:223 (-) Transcript_18224:245-913(-)